MVKVTLDGQHEMKALSLDPSLLQESHEVIEDVIIAAYHDARGKIENLMKKEMANIAQEMGLPQDVAE